MTYVRRADRFTAQIGDTITINGCDLVTPKHERATCRVTAVSRSGVYVFLSVEPSTPEDAQIMELWQQPEGGA